MNVQLETAWPPLVAFAVGVALLAGIVWAYRGLRGKARPRLRRFFLALRIAAAALLLLLALEPVVRADRLRTEDARVVVLLDTSASMATPDSYEGRSRYDVARDLLLGEGGLVEAIAEEIPVTLQRFDLGPVPIEPDDLPPRAEGALTDLAGALRALASGDGMRRMASFGGAAGDSRSSLLAAADDAAAAAAEVPCLSWTHWLALAQPPRIDLFKVDIEGGEFELLPTMATYLAAHRPQLMLSTHAPYLAHAERAARLGRLADALHGYRHCMNERGEDVGVAGLLAAETHERFRTFFLTD